MTVPLEALAAELNARDFLAEYTPPSATRPFDYLLVALDPPPMPTPPQLTAQLFFMEELLLQNRPEALAAARQAIGHLQILWEWPMKLDNLSTERLGQIHQLLNRCNQILPNGHLGVNPQNQVYFKYVMVTQGQEILPDLLEDILKMMQFFLSKLQPILQNAVETQFPLKEILQQLETALAQSE